MKKTLIGLLGSTVICVLFLAGCIDEHYGEDSNTIVTNLTGYAWERTFQIRTEDGRNAEGTILDKNSSVCLSCYSSDIYSKSPAGKFH